MNFNLLQATSDHKTVIRHLLQFYIYDFSEYTGHDVDDNGLFAAYPGLETYWEEENKFPYLIEKNDKYIGFVLVKSVRIEDRCYFSVAEFFILKKYRHQGAGKAIATAIFNLHRGPWEVYQMDSNTPAQLFWNRVIAEYTKGQFTERSENGRRIQNFEN
jgi:predicted acetyltransferase